MATGHDAAEQDVVGLADDYSDLVAGDGEFAVAVLAAAAADLVERSMDFGHEAAVDDVREVGPLDAAAAGGEVEDNALASDTDCVDCDSEAPVVAAAEAGAGACSHHGDVEDVIDEAASDCLAALG